MVPAMLHGLGPPHQTPTYEFTSQTLMFFHRVGFLSVFLSFDTKKEIQKTDETLTKEPATQASSPLDADFPTVH